MFKTVLQERFIRIQKSGKLHLLNDMAKHFHLRNWYFRPNRPWFAFHKMYELFHILMHMTTKRFGIYSMNKALTNFPLNNTASHDPPSQVICAICFWDSLKWVSNCLAARRAFDLYNHATISFIHRSRNNKFTQEFEKLLMLEH